MPNDRFVWADGGWCEGGGEGVSEVVMSFALLLCVSSLSRWKLETRKLYT